MLKKLFKALDASLLAHSPRYAIWGGKKMTAPDRFGEVRQIGRTRLMHAYMHFSSRENDAKRIHDETCADHLHTRYSSPLQEALIAWQIASFKLHHLKDAAGAFTYASHAFILARQHDIKLILSHIEEEFPQLLTN